MEESVTKIIAFIASIAISVLLVYLLYQHTVSRIRRYNNLLSEKHKLEQEIESNNEKLHQEESAKKEESEQIAKVEEKSSVEVVENAQQEAEAQSVEIPQEKEKDIFLEGNILVSEDAGSNIKEIIEIISVNNFTIRAQRYEKRASDNKYHKSVEVFYSTANCRNKRPIEWRGITEEELKDLIFYR